jgi:hypothetical protein
MFQESSRGKEPIADAAELGRAKVGIKFRRCLDRPSKKTTVLAAIDEISWELD